MNMTYVITCCSTVDLSEERLKERNIPYIPFHFFLSDQEYLDNFGKSMDPHTLYERMINGEMSRTSQCSIGEYDAFFRQYLEKGIDVLHFTLSSGISGTYNSACLAAEQLRDDFPERTIEIIDSLSASSGYGMLVEMAKDKADEGKSLEEVKGYALNLRENLNHWFITTDLTFFIRGGRVTKTAGFFGKMFNICPLLDVDPKGGLRPLEKVRLKSRAMKRLVEKMEECADGGTAYSGRCYISQSDCFEDARAVADMIEEKFPALKGKVEIYPIGATIGCHTGPGTIALFFTGKQRQN